MSEVNKMCLARVNCLQISLSLPLVINSSWHSLRILATFISSLFIFFLYQKLIVVVETIKRILQVFIKTSFCWNILHTLQGLKDFSIFAIHFLLSFLTQQIQVYAHWRGSQELFSLFAKIQHSFFVARKQHFVG